MIPAPLADRKVFYVFSSLKLFLTSFLPSTLVFCLSDVLSKQGVTKGKESQDHKARTVKMNHFSPSTHKGMPSVLLGKML